MSHLNHMSRRWGLRFGCHAVFAGVFALALAASDASATVTRSQRCTILQNQLNEQIKAHSGSNRSANAASIGVKARKLCAGNKQAQGLRAYAKALQLFGIQPIDPR
jgi:hypothetical protein